MPWSKGIKNFFNDIDLGIYSHAAIFGRKHIDFLVRTDRFRIRGYKMLKSPKNS